MSRQQTTLQRAVELAGIGLHTGEAVTMCVAPASAGTGLVFVRGEVRIPARPENVQPGARNTTLARGGAKVHTVEHVLAALHGCGVDNAEIALSADEPPVMDGSALPLCRALRDAGLAELDAPAEVFSVPRITAVRDAGHAAVLALPADTLRISFFISYDHDLIPHQEHDVEITAENFLEQIAPARTYGFIEEVEALRAAGLALGGSEENALVIRPDGYSSELRFDNEPVRHKILDMVGDLALLGRCVRGHFVGFRSGHSLTGLLVKKLLG